MRARSSLKKCVEFVITASPPFAGQLLSLRNRLFLHESMLKKQAIISSIGWETQQQAKAVRATQEGECDPMKLTRDYRILATTRGAIVQLRSALGSGGMVQSLGAMPGSNSPW